MRNCYSARTRRAWSLLTGVASLLSSVLIVLWASSYWFHPSYSWETRRKEKGSVVTELRTIASTDGVIQFVKARVSHAGVNEVDRLPHWNRADQTYWGEPVSRGTSRFTAGTAWNRLGFVSYVDPIESWSGMRGRSRDVFSLPFWFLTIIVALIPLYQSWQVYRRMRRAAAGACVQCGFDLRATPGRCPECGTAVASDADNDVGRSGEPISRLAR
jgi:hypothetical protein